jgi:hypothetical protein
VPHVDPDTLALWALGEAAGTAADEDHAASCADCRGTLAQLSDLVATARQDGAPVELVPPPPQLWDRIAAAAGTPDPAPRPRVIPGQAPAPSGAAAGTSAAGTSAAASPGLRPQMAGRTAGHAGARPPRPRRRGGRSWALRTRLAVAAAAGIVIGAGAAVGITQLTAGSPPAATSAQADLRPLPQFPQWRNASGTAVMRVTSAAQVMQVSLNAPAESGFYEVWLLGRDGVSMISLGELPASHTGSFTIPAGTNLGFYSRIDVSLQPFNGSTVHSKTSVVRGSLPAVS